MITDLRTAADVDVPAGAVVVVGSGAAGLALSERLAALGRAVVLLESGGEVRAPVAPAALNDSGAPGDSAADDVSDGVPDDGAGVDDLNVGTSSGLAYVGLSGGRTRVLGGAAQLWHGQCTRLHEIDIEPRPWIAHSGWPIALGDLDGAYAAAEQWLDVSGRGYGEHRWGEHPRLEPLAWDTRRLLHDFTEYTPAPMLGTVHRAAVVADPSIRLVVHATVTRVITAGARVTGVEVAAPGGRRTLIEASHVVLAGGAIENARILALSDPDGVGLGTGREHTGRFLQDHPVIEIADVSSADHHTLQDRYVALHRDGRRLYPKVRLAPDAQRSHGLLDANAVFIHEHADPGLAAARRVLLAARAGKLPEHVAADVLRAAGSLGPVARSAFRRYVRGIGGGGRPSRVTLQVWLEQQPDVDSRVTLGTGVDALGLRRAEVHWKVGELEMRTSRQLTRWIGADLERLGAGLLRPRPAMWDDDAWRATVTDAFHPAGTTRMAETPEQGVVDPNLQVHGVGGLYALGSSVFPISGYANPTLTIVALAFRLAAHLQAAVPVG